MSWKFHKYSDLDNTNLKGWGRGKRDCRSGKDCCCFKERTTGGKYFLLGVKMSFLMSKSLIRRRFWTEFIEGASLCCAGVGQIQGRDGSAG